VASAPVPLTSQAVAELVSGRLRGDGTRLLTAVGPLEGADGGTLSFLGSARYLPEFRTSAAGAVLIRAEHEGEAGGPPVRIIVPDPHAALLRLLPVMFPVAPHIPRIDPSARIGPGTTLGVDVSIGPHTVLGRDVVVGNRVRLGAGVILEDRVIVGDDTEIYPFGSIGLAPQDLKYQGEATRLVIGRRNIFREFVTINRGTRGGGGVTTIGDRNVFMAYVHVAHDSTVGDDTIFGPHATLGGHVAVESYANISAGSAVHQFCRVGQHGFIGGYSVITKDALPFARTIGSRPARIFGANTVGLTRRGFSAEVIAKLKRSFRYLLQSKLNTTRALQQIEQDKSLACPEVLYLIDFIRTSQRGVILRRSSRRAEEVIADE